MLLNWLNNDDSDAINYYIGVNLAKVFRDTQYSEPASGDEGRC